MPTALSAHDLASVTATLDEVRANIGAGAAETPIIGAAVERIQDIAFALRERNADPALCDALDAAVQDIAAATGRLLNLNGLVDDLARQIEAAPEANIVAVDRADRPAAAESPSRSVLAPAQGAGLAALPEMDALTLNSAAASAANQNESAPPSEGFTARGGLFEVDLHKNQRMIDALSALAASVPGLTGSSDARADTAPVRDAALTRATLQADFPRQTLPPRNGPHVPSSSYIDPPDFMSGSRVAPAARPVDATPQDGTPQPAAAAEFTQPLSPDTPLGAVEPPQAPSFSDGAAAAGAASPAEHDAESVGGTPNVATTAPPDGETNLPDGGAGPASVAGEVNLPDGVANSDGGEAGALGGDTGPPDATALPELRVAQGQSMRDVASGTSDDPLAEIRGLSQDELLALFG
jgi:hypothetical protein